MHRGQDMLGTSIGAWTSTQCCQHLPRCLSAALISSQKHQYSDLSIYEIARSPGCQRAVCLMTSATCQRLRALRGRSGTKLT